MILLQLLDQGGFGAYSIGGTFVLLLEEVSEGRELDPIHRISSLLYARSSLVDLLLEWQDGKSHPGSCPSPGKGLPSLFLASLRLESSY